MSTPGSDGHEQSFADVLSSLSNTPRLPRGYRERTAEPAAEQLAIPWLATSRPAAEPSSGWGSAAEGTLAATWPEVSDEWDEPEDVASAVRPYPWTRGRTRPVYDLAVEALVSTSPQGRDLAALTSVEHRAVAELCRTPRSVAEVAALLCLPLGVARVLLGDMAEIGLVVVHRTATSSGEVSEFDFMERVLSGLRRL
ncbi:MAG: DUF742 domain-containing protein [Pseudonocardiaceae bacterium]